MKKKQLHQHSWDSLARPHSRLTMRTSQRKAWLYRLSSLIPLLVTVLLTSCVSPSNSNSRVAQTTPSPNATPANEEPRAQLTLPILDALLGQESFVNELQSKLQLSSDQIDSLKRVAAAEINRLRETNAEDLSGDPAEARNRATKEINAILGEEKTNKLASLSYEFWSRAGEELEGSIGTQAAMALSPMPNAIPSDTRVVVNIPAFRMDLFDEGKLIKSYKIGIGYPEFPLPQGLRKAQTIIFNPTWTPPDSPWVAKMNVTPGEKIEAGSKLNPLGAVKIPIGMPSLIHGGKSVAKLGSFASHGCVGLTNPQVKDFAKLLTRVSDTEINEATIERYWVDKTNTKTVKLSQAVPVELRYETIVVEDGKLHIYKDVYAQDTNTEENLRTVLDAHGVRFDDLSEDQKAQVLYALNAMSAQPKPMPTPSSLVATNETANANQTEKKKTKRGEKKPPKNQKEVVVELSALAGRGYPAPVNFDDGTGKPAQTVAAR
jgi:lipoprotein-anchoring transpeptidase ErfK/SrfK